MNRKDRAELERFRENAKRLLYYRLLYVNNPLRTESIGAWRVVETAGSRKRPLSELEPSQCFLEMFEWAQDDYRAAGVLPYAFHRNKLFFLFGCEERKTGTKGLLWNAFAGKRENIDTDAAATAWREMDEESGSLLASFNADIVSAMHSKRSLKIWHQPSKLLLFLVEIPFSLKLSADFETIKANCVSEKCSMVEIRWISMSELLEAVRSNQFSLDSAVLLTEFIRSTLRTTGVLSKLQRLQRTHSWE